MHPDTWCKGSSFSKTNRKIENKKSKINGKKTIKKDRVLVEKTATETAAMDFEAAAKAARQIVMFVKLLRSDANSRSAS